MKIHVKRGDENLFLFETTVEAPLSELVVQLVRLQNGRLKVSRLCQGMLIVPHTAYVVSTCTYRLIVHDMAGFEGIL